MKEVSYKDKVALVSLQKAQDNYRILTKRKYAYFLTIHNKYLPPIEIEYCDTVSYTPIPKVFNKKTELKRELSYAAKQRWSQK